MATFVFNWVPELFLPVENNGRVLSPVVMMRFDERSHALFIEVIKFSEINQTEPVFLVGFQFLHCEVIPGEVAVGV